MDEFEHVRQILEGHRLVTAKIYYWMPDYPDILQMLVIQVVDLPPSYPKLQRLVDFWEQNIDGPLHSIEVADTELTFDRSPVRCGRGEFLIH